LTKTDHHLYSTYNSTTLTFSTLRNSVYKKPSKQLIFKKLFRIEMQKV